MKTKVAYAHPAGKEEKHIIIDYQKEHKIDDLVIAITKKYDLEPGKYLLQSRKIWENEWQIHNSNTKICLSNIYDGKLIRLVLNKDVKNEIFENTKTWQGETHQDKTAQDKKQKHQIVPTPLRETQFTPTKITIPQEINTGEKQKISIANMIIPVAIAGVAYALTEIKLMLITAAISPIMLLISLLENRRNHNKKTTQQQKQYLKELQTIEEKIQQLQSQEIKAKTSETHSLKNLLKEVSENNYEHIWQSQNWHKSYLNLAIAQGNTTSEISIEEQKTHTNQPDPKKLKKLAQEIRKQKQKILQKYAEIKNIEQVINLNTHPHIAITGQEETAKKILRTAIIKLGYTHSPANINISIIAENNNPENKWLCWMPHATNKNNSQILTQIWGNPQEIDEKLGSIKKLLLSHNNGSAAIPEQKIDIKSRQPLGAHPSSIIILIYDLPAQNIAQIIDLCQTKSAIKICTIWLSENTQNIPTICSAIIDTQNQEIHFTNKNTPQKYQITESLTLRQAEAASMALSPLTDISKKSTKDSGLKKRLLWAEIAEKIAKNEHDIHNNWQKNKWQNTLTALVGENAQSSQHLDLQAQGPHALIGGTTGSGKSEFLQNWIISLACEYSPQDLNFFLIDYKGGSAFSRCSNLAHTITMLSDLKVNAQQRALEYLKAEIRKRENLLATYKVKDLASLRNVLCETSQEDDSLSAKEINCARLVIIIDEFATLIKEYPEFIDGIVDIAQRGRSLGIYLIAATQRPGSSVPESIKANTNLRVSLRVSDESESHNIIYCKDAAHISQQTPGRIIYKTAGEKVKTFQSTYLGSSSLQDAQNMLIQIEECLHEPKSKQRLHVRRERNTVATAVATAGEPSEQTDTNAGAPGATAGPPSINAGPPDITSKTRSQAKDLPELVRIINNTAKTYNYSPANTLWHESLAKHVNLYSLASSNKIGSYALALADMVQIQAQKPWMLDFDTQKSIIVYGSPRSGKSSFLLSLAARICLELETKPCHVYAISDSSSLAALKGLDETVQLIDTVDAEKVMRLFVFLENTLKQRIQQYNIQSCTGFVEYKENILVNKETKALNNCLLSYRIVILIDGIEKFLLEHELNISSHIKQEIKNSYASIANSFYNLLAKGPAYGIHFVASSTRPSNINSRLLSLFGQEICFKLNNASDYALLSLPANIIANNTPGRAIINTTQNKNSKTVLELQFASFFHDKNNAFSKLNYVFISELIKKVSLLGYKKIHIIEDLASTIHANMLPAGQEDNLNIALEYVSKDFRTAKRGLFTIWGHDNSGQNSTIKALAFNHFRLYSNTGGRFLFSFDNISDLKAHNIWSSEYYGANKMNQALHALSAELKNIENSGNNFFRNSLFVFDNINDSIAVDSEETLIDFFKLCLSKKVFLALNVDSNSPPKSMKFGGLFRSCKQILLLCPSNSDAPFPFRFDLAGTMRSLAFNPGRGFLITNTSCELVQALSH